MKNSKLDQIDKLNVVPNSNPLGMKRFVRGISMSFKCEYFIIYASLKACNLQLFSFEHSPLSHGGHIVPGDQKSFVLPRLTPMVSTARLGVVKQSFFGLPGQYGRRVTRANSWGFKQTILCPNMDKNKIEAARGENGTARLRYMQIRKFLNSEQPRSEPE